MRQQSQVRLHEGLGSSFDVIVRKELETVKRHRTKDWKLKQVAFKIVDDGENERATEYDNKLDELPEGYESDWYPVWNNTDYEESMIGTTMKGVKRCIELHKFSVSQGYGITFYYSMCPCQVTYPWTSDQ